MSPNPTLPLGLAHGRLRVHIASDDPMVRAALDGIGNLRSDIELVDALAPADVILWEPAGDSELPDGAEPTPVVALVDDRQAASAALAIGAAGAVERTADHALLLSALVAAHHGLSVLTPQFVESALPPPRESTGQLTPRELEILDGLAEGLSNRALAKHLEISEHTVKFHVNAILLKLNARSRTEAVVIAARTGIVSL